MIERVEILKKSILGDKERNENYEGLNKIIAAITRWDGSINFQFCSSPVSSLGVVFDVVIGFVSEPVWKGSVLSLLLGKTLLH